MCVVKGLAVGAGGVLVSSSQVARRPHRSSSPFSSAGRASLRQISPCERLPPAGSVCAAPEYMQAPPDPARDSSTSWAPRPCPP